jgi:hyperosmotically inducible protein
MHVTTHWFPTGTASGGADALIESEIESEVLRIEAVQARHVAVDVWGGHVVLTGLVRQQSQIDTAVANIKQIKQVRSVTSYVTLN